MLDLAAPSTPVGVSPHTAVSPPGGVSPPAAVSPPAGVPPPQAGYVSAREFNAFVQAMLARQQAGVVTPTPLPWGYTTQYAAVPTAAPPTPIDQRAGATPVAITAVRSAGLPWWVWLLGVAVVGGGVYYVFFIPPPRRRRAVGRQKVGGPTGQVAPQAGAPRRRSRRR